MESLKHYCEMAFDRWDRNYVLYALLILLGMYGLGQLTAPYIAHDDYDWLLKGFDQGFESPFSKAGSEGRWGNFAWSQISHYLNGYSAFGLYLVLFSMLCLALARVVSPRAGVFAALLFFLAPMTADTAKWPVTQVTGVMVTLLGCVALLRVHDDGRRRLVVFMSVVAGFLFYPSFGPLFLLMYAAACSATRRSALLGAAVYVLAFVVAVVLVFSLNYAFHGYFGIKPAAWREATPLLEGGSLQGNVTRYLAYFGLLRDIWPALIAGGIAFVACFRNGVRARNCMVALMYGAMLMAMDATLSILSGVGLPLRSTLWVWLLVCMPVIFLVHERRTIILGLLLSLPIAFVGISGWNSAFSNTRTVFPAMNSLGNALTRVQAANAGEYDDVIMFGDVHANSTLAWLHGNRALRNYLYKEFGVYTRPCEESLCERILAELQQRPENPEWIIVDRHLVWVLSPQRDNGY
ncbi:hypothetical protein [Stenotrophomonas sp. 22385]|uniref:hypothetical protein n=1 Tax=Stenotrophomonas sp. 22385 TaxID=3453915 RepID=UPI003F826B3A